MSVRNWEQNISEVIGEIKRALRINGTVIIFETLGTGSETPSAPDFLQPYYSKLVHDYGFSHKWIRTDYTFDNVKQAEELTRFFFRGSRQHFNENSDVTGLAYFLTLSPNSTGGAARTDRSFNFLLFQRS